jgi:pSer/pThr/pTyr-binding forkhead associated (FHA) protein
MTGRFITAKEHDARSQADDRRQPARHTITGPGPWLLGRAQEADIAFPDDRSCSREQARIVRAEDGFVIEHLSHASSAS